MITDKTDPTGSCELDGDRPGCGLGVHQLSFSSSAAGPVGAGGRRESDFQQGCEVGGGLVGVAVLDGVEEG
ncbi:hypothetical protein, partial [Rhodococcus sp. LB1]|uniref:hypothetical protein n=1 Tax=Rhodococcus sp. LB1 TaxID=1807499 RepID=UPI001E495E87